MSHTPQDAHFISNPDISLLASPPHKTIPVIFQALTATALFRIWPVMLFFGGWSAMIVLVNRYTAAEMSFPSTMITVLGESVIIRGGQARSSRPRCPARSHTELPHVLGV